MQKLKAYLDLTKLRIGIFILIITTLGFFLGGRGIQSYSLLLNCLIGTFLTCAGSAVLNNYIERDSDRKMDRTCCRPLPKGVVSATEALLFGIFCVLAGTSFLIVSVNLLTGFLALLTAFLYVLVYTPLKRVTWMNTMVGAIPGALPTMGGWAAATGSLDWGAWALFAILFVWQHPHFYSIAWIYRDDYRRAGIQMLPSVEKDGLWTFRIIIWGAILLIPVSLLPATLGLSGAVYVAGSLALGLVFVGVGLAFSRSHSDEYARLLLRTSLAYLPMLLALIVADVSF